MEDLIAVFGIDYRMLLVQIVNFTILLGALGYFLYTPLIRFLDKRREEIIETIHSKEAAERQLREAEALKSEAIAKAAAEAKTMIENAKAGAKTQAQAIIESAEGDAKRLLENAQREAEEAKRRALAEGKETIARMIVLGAEKVLHERTQSAK